MSCPFIHSGRCKFLKLRCSIDDWHNCDLYAAYVDNEFPDDEYPDAEY